MVDESQKIEHIPASNHVEITATPENQLKKTTHKQLESFSETVGEIVGTVGEMGGATAKQTQRLIEQTTQTVGQFVHRLGENWLIRKLSGVLNLNWLFGAVESVNLEQAEAAVKKLQQQYPQESPSQIAHRIILEKAIQAGGIGLATSLIPGEALALLAVDLTATTKLQSEMVYQIAYAYGLDLQDSTRKGEVLAIFGLALGGSRLLKAAGLGLLRNIPFAGAIIGASTNSTMIYSLGYAACRFYETKLDASKKLTNEDTLATLKEQSENYLEKAIAQEAVMDQILVHMILASNPTKTWSEILPELKALNLSSAEEEIIAENIKSPQPLETLLNQLNRDFAFPLLAQCYRIAQLNGEISFSEQTVLEAIATKFNINLNSIKLTIEQ
ncbi:MAG: hypothetical protein PUP93_14900 [Rhizonema sp. NSF051]|nr:hypothetical protein [Rhizonema sp. NSF051]